MCLCVSLVWNQLNSRLSKERKSLSCLNKHIDLWRAVSPWELWSPLCWFGLMGVWWWGGGCGGEASSNRRDHSFHSSFIAWPRYTEKQNSPLMQLNAGSGSPGDRAEQTEVFVTSQLSASEFTLESRALVLWMGGHYNDKTFLGDKQLTHNLSLIYRMWI